MIDVLWHDNCYKATIMTGWWFQTLFIFHHIWDVILPIDELHHFSRLLLHQQPDDDILELIIIMNTVNHTYPNRFSNRFTLW